VVLIPVPDVVLPPGDLVSVQVPDKGRPPSITLPVETVQVGAVTAPDVGAEGVAGWALIAALAEDIDVQPAELVTVKVYVPVAIPDTVVVVPVPEVVTAPGVLVTVHVPVAGRPLKATLPVATPQVGWVIMPITGAVGVAGWVVITTLADDTDMQPSELVTVYV
jgi:hypothetical protein